MWINMEKIKQTIKSISFGILSLLLYLLLPNLLVPLMRDLLLSTNFWIHNLSFLSIYLITFLIIFLIARKDIIKQWKSFLKNHKQILSKGLTYWVYGIIVMIISNLIITAIIGNIAVNEQVTRETLLLAPLYAIPTITLIGPFLEELVFRYGFRKPFKKEITYAIFCALLFGGLHVITAIEEWKLANIFISLFLEGEILFLIPYGSLGFFFAKAYYETENIFSSVIPHMLHNTISVLLILLTHFLQM